MDGPDSTPYPSRISVACSICRSKKRKCSGERPTCAECHASGLTCDWPKQMKRGPAKNYIRTLEARLNTTEYLLRNLLEQVSDEQLVHTLQAAETPGIDSKYASKGSIAGHWQTYPLTDLDNIRAWQRNTRIHKPTAVLSSQAAPGDGGNPQWGAVESPPGIFAFDQGHSTTRASNGRASNRNGNLSSNADNRQTQFASFNTKTQQKFEAAQEGSSAPRESSVELLPAIVDADDIQMAPNSDICLRGSSSEHRQLEDLGENSEEPEPLIPISFQKQFLW